jgi:hypothetical protein
MSCRGWRIKPALSFKPSQLSCWLGLSEWGSAVCHRKSVMWEAVFALASLPIPSLQRKENRYV